MMKRIFAPKAAGGEVPVSRVGKRKEGQALFSIIGNVPRPQSARYWFGELLTWARRNRAIPERPA